MKPFFSDNLATVIHGTAEQVLPTLADASVDLIATDPPYFGVKADEAWDNQWDTPEAFVAWIGSLCVEWRRVLKPNGSLYVFASPDMAARVECEVRRHFNVLNRIRWRKPQGWHNKTEKESLRSYLSPCEEIIFAESPCRDPRFADADYELWGRIVNPLRMRLRVATSGHREKMVAIFAADGRYSSRESIRVNAARQLGWLPTEFELMSASIYHAVTKVANLGMSYEELCGEFSRLRAAYERGRRPFNLTASVPFLDEWDFPTVSPYPGKHPCEKPLPLMEHIVSVSSRPGDVVLDSFCGSGTTLRAASNLGRRSIGIEQDERWCRWTEGRLRQTSLFAAEGAA